MCCIHTYIHTIDVGNAYSLPQQWSRYIGAVQRSAQHSSLLSTTTPTATAAASARGSVDSMGQESSQEEARLQGKRHIAKKAVFRVGDSSTGSAHQEDFGLLGRNGISAGAFLVSPYADDPEVADIQMSVFPSVRLLSVYFNSVSSLFPSYYSLIMMIYDTIPCRLLNHITWR